MKKEYETEIYNNPIIIPVVAILILLSSITACIYIGKLINSSLLSLWIPVLILFSPFIFSKIIKNNLMKKRAVLNFDNTEFTITLFSISTGLELTKKIFLLQDIIGYKFYFDAKNNTSLTIYLYDKKKETFIFKDNKTFKQALEQESVFSNFYSFIKLSPHDQKILPRLSFLATSAGAVIILIELACILFALIMHIVKNTFSSSYYLILAVGFIIQQIVSRNQNKSIYEKILKLG